MSHNKNYAGEVWDNYLKIAMAQKEVKNDGKQKGHEHDEKSFHDSQLRHDSLTIEQINKLYGTKGDSPKEMQYTKNIMEIAHPEPLVIAPSYDRLNGLIENENEGQAIRIHIVQKPNNGQLTQHKYAEKNLLLSLVRVANHLDQTDQHQLCALADVCLGQVSGIRKQAFWPLAAGVAALVGAVYLKQHMAFHSDGFTADYQKAMGEIDDLLTSNDNFGVGYKYTPEFLRMVGELKTKLGELNDGVQKIMPILSNLETPRTGKELAAISRQPETQAVSQALAEFRAVLSDVNPFINQVVANFSNEGFKQRSIAEKGLLTSWTDAASVLHGGKGLVADDFDDVAHALATLKGDVDNMVKGLASADSLKNSVDRQLQSSRQEVNKDFAGKQDGGEEAGKGGLGSELEEMGKRLLGEK